MSTVSLKILLVEDNQLNQIMASETLKSLGHQVTLAANGQEAVELVTKQPFELVLMDLVMPVLDGFGACQEILRSQDFPNEQRPEIVALTATLSDEDKARCRSVGMARWLSKPLEPDAINELVEELFRSKSQASPEFVFSELLDRVTDSETLGNIVELFAESHPQRVAELRLSVTDRNPALGRRAVHTLKGNFLNFGATHAANLAGRIEETFENRNWDSLGAFIFDLEKQCEAVESSLRQRVSMLAEESPGTRTQCGGLSGKGRSVIVCDDDPTSRLICSAPLSAEGYTVVQLTDGTEVLEYLSREPADVVLMGVQMSTLSGIETCRKLKDDEKTRMIPVLLVTALDEREAKLTGIAAGADDFITKPIDSREVSLRVRNAARSKALYDQLQTSFQDLQRMEKLRDGLAQMLVHDLRTPLTAIKGYAGLLTTGFSAGLNAQQLKFAERIVASSNVLVEMVSSILDVSRLESDEMPLNTEELALSDLLAEQGEQFRGLPDVELVFDFHPEMIVNCDRSLVGRVVANLLSNAFKYTPKGETVKLRCYSSGDSARVEVLDRGPGVPEDQRSRIFEKFAQVEGEQHSKPYSSGLGLTFCQLVVEKHGGNIAVEQAEGGGSNFWFTLPLLASRRDS